MKLILVSSTPVPPITPLFNITTLLASAAAAGKRAIIEDQKLHPMLDQQQKSTQENDMSNNNGLARNYIYYTIFGPLIALAALISILAYVIIRKKRKQATTATILESKQESVKTSTTVPQFTLQLTTVQQQQRFNEVMPPAGVDSDLEKVTNGQGANAVAMTKLSNGPNMVAMVNGHQDGHSVQPILIKAKGLLDRRGSNTSLTIAVNPIVVETCHLPTPPKECSTMEYLTSAGNRMTRSQLRVCLKDTKMLHQEFLDIPLNHPCKPNLPGCSSKNRYKSIWPNEATRVILPLRQQNNHRCRRSSISQSTSQRIEDQINSNSHPMRNRFFSEDTATDRESGGGSKFEFEVPTVETKDEIDDDQSSSYINANYIRGYETETKAYIAAQGPLTNTIDDFWSMVWHERCPCIVMMTRLKENNRVKCEPYLPSKDAQYGDVHVTVRSSTPRNGYYVKELQLKRENEVRYVKHFWFTHWPDHKAPASTAKQLIELVQDVESERQRQSKIQKHGQENNALLGPVVVHCSAGLGRTGCFNATSMGMKQLHEENMVDILGIVCQLRLDRGGMIQTVEQYEFIHYALIQYERQLPETPSLAPAPLTPLTANSINNNYKYELPVN